MRRFRLKTFIFVGIVAEGMVSWSRYDLAVNYMPVAGVVDATTTKCRVEKADSLAAKNASPMPCYKAYATLEQDHAFQGYRIVPVTTIAWHYVSPVDRKTHTGYTVRNDQAYHLPQPGTPVTIYAHKKAADISRIVT